MFPGSSMRRLINALSVERLALPHGQISDLLGRARVLKPLRAYIHIFFVLVSLLSWTQ